ncbi:hypothetical protein [Rickettsia endosymbiont of Polydrusus tereticollis]|uniref:hypothetical protein n=1 Tax=Rickettsia endosymbiont of Polydrusus tereticollis TaxID=3066251 RepID=UPI0031334470
MLLPTVTTSEATTKNQLLDIDTTIFHTKEGIAKGTSICQNLRHPDILKILARILHEI